MPITVENESYEFDLKVNTVAAGKLEPEFNLFLEVKNVLVIFPVKFEMTVTPKPEAPTLPPPGQAEQENQDAAAKSE
jgi:hypothetical protein